MILIQLKDHYIYSNKDINMYTLKEALKGRLRRFGSKIITQTKEECKYFPKYKVELKSIIEYRVKEDPNCDLNDIWVGDITTMSNLFEKSPFNGDISRWDVSNVRDMNYMFYNSKFNGDISSWNVSKVENMYSMFDESDFNGDISDWNVSNVKYMKYMFFKSDFNGDISDWDVSNVKSMKSMFAGCPLSKNPPKWYKG